MAETPAFETVTEAVAYLTEHGYTTDLVLAAGGLKENGGTAVFAPEVCAVEHQWRFEGESNPDDEDIVLGVRLSNGTKGVVTSAYGKDMDAEHIAVLQALTAAR
ncbi:MAG: hypothetical protein QOE63_669 [Acidimicrobiaceae bacterium]